jgi:mannose-1-phosphate guanylyltransferase
MQALILAGGKGTRLRPLTVYTPKPVVPMLNRPFLTYQLKVLAGAGVSGAVLSLSYQPDKIEQIMNSEADQAVRLRYVTETSPLGTAGAYRFALEGTDETAFVLNGDILTDIDLSAMLKFHRENNAEATIATVKVKDPSRYGVIHVGKGDRIERFVEKPGANNAELKSNVINAGMYIFEPSVLKRIKKDANSSFEYHVFPEMLESGAKLFSYSIDKHYWLDIGTPQNYLEAHHDLLDGRLVVPEQTNGDAEIATRAEIDKVSIIGKGCVIKPGASITRSVLGPGVHVDEKAVIDGSVIWAHTRVSSMAEIRDSVIGRSCHIGRNTVIRHGSVLGDKTSLTDYTTV